MQSDEQIIQELMDRLVKEVKYSLPIATGRTAKSVHGVQDKDGMGFQILGGLQIGALINGRKPTSSGAKKGSPSLQEAILEWIEAKSIQPKETSMTQLQLSWAISQSIHRHGTEGNPHLFDDVFNGNSIREAGKKLLVQRSHQIKSDILKQFKK